MKLFCLSGKQHKIMKCKGKHIFINDLYNLVKNMQIKRICCYFLLGGVPLSSKHCWHPPPHQLQLGFHSKLPNAEFFPVCCSALNCHEEEVIECKGKAIKNSKPNSKDRALSGMNGRNEIQAADKTLPEERSRSCSLSSAMQCPESRFNFTCSASGFLRVSIAIVDSLQLSNSQSIGLSS